MILDKFARVSLAHLPTALEPLPRLSQALGGPEIWVKRDDCTGLAAIKLVAETEGLLLDPVYTGKTMAV